MHTEHLASAPYESTPTKRGPGRPRGSSSKGNAARNAAIVDAVRNGASYGEASKKFGLTSVAIGVICRHAGVRSQYKAPRTMAKPERNEAICAAVAAGATYRDIAERFFISWQRVGQICRRAGMARRGHK